MGFNSEVGILTFSYLRDKFLGMPGTISIAKITSEKEQIRYGEFGAVGLNYEVFINSLGLSIAEIGFIGGLQGVGVSGVIILKGTKKPLGYKEIKEEYESTKEILNQLLVQAGGKTYFRLTE